VVLHPVFLVPATYNTVNYSTNLYWVAYSCNSNGNTGNANNTNSPLTIVPLFNNMSSRISPTNPLDNDTLIGYCNGTHYYGSNIIIL